MGHFSWLQLLESVFPEVVSLWEWVVFITFRGDVCCEEGNLKGRLSPEMSVPVKRNEGQSLLGSHLFLGLITLI